MKKRVLTLLALVIGISPLWATNHAFPNQTDIAMQSEETVLDTITGYIYPEWNDYEFVLKGNSYWINVGVSEGHMNYNKIYVNDGMLTVDVEVDVVSTLTFTSNYNGNNSHLIVTHNGAGIISLNNTKLNDTQVHSIELVPGTHTIQFQGIFYLTNLGIAKTELITVNLLEPGSLNTEILYNVDNLKDVRCLKIKGQMNDDDWKIIKMMKSNLFTLDLSEAITTAIPEECFRYSYSEPIFLHTIILPEGLKSIGVSAFYESSLKNINFPSTLESIGSSAFSHTSITAAILPESCINIGSYCFRECYSLTDMQLSNKLTHIPEFMCEKCYDLNPFNLPQALTSVGSNAFSECHKVYFDLPESLSTIEAGAFRSTNTGGVKQHLKIPNNISRIRKDAFLGTGYISAELPVSFFKTCYSHSQYDACYRFLGYGIKTLRLNCATVVDVWGEASLYSLFDNEEILSNVTLQVPQHLVNSYKSDEYWYNAKAIEGFSTEEIDHWNIRRDLVLDARSRLLGTPSIKIYGDGSLKINGEDGMTINNLLVDSSPENRLYTSRFISNADNVTVEGDLITYFDLPHTGRWYYITLPYDIKAGDIVINDANLSGQRAVRYYDGATRATNGASGNWKNYEADDVIPAGTGFIMQVSRTGWWRFPAQNNESKQYMTSYKMFVKGLAANPSDNPSNRGWNLVGNPYQAFYNIHKLNFTAPITVREDNKYAAYSIIDDDYALAPNQAFFVQCPEGLSEISFPLDGRQMTDKIESQVGAKPMSFAGKQARRLTDITLAFGEQTDRTRVVLNEQATMGYDMSADAGKFMGDEGVAQIYSHDGNGTSYAINERPEGNGTVSLGFVAGEDGQYSISVSRNDGSRVVLVDNELGITADITSDAYEFTATAGTYEKRFEVRLGNSGVTDIDNVVELKDKITAVDGGISAGVPAEIYNMAGVKVAETDGGIIPLASGHYLVKAQGSVVKVYVK